jgi:hypothetical protein
MSRRYPIQQVAVWLAVVGFCVPQAALAAGPAGDQSPLILDVALHDGGTLVGQVVDAQGIPQANSPVSLRSATHELAAGQTNAQGYFAFSGLNSGVYQVVTSSGAGVYRVWSQSTAPPAAQPGALIVADGSTVRGHLLSCLGCHPLIVAGVVVAAIAIPVAVHNQKKPSSP